MDDDLQEQAGLWSRIRGRSWSRWESTVLTGVWVEAGVGSFLLTATLARSREIHSSTDNDFGQTVILRSENIGRQQEKATGSMEIKL